MKSWFDIELSRGGSVQAMLRAARRCESIYQAIVKAVPGQKAVTPDETGWRIGGTPAWLHAFAARRMTCCVIDRLRGGEVAERALQWIRVNDANERLAKHRAAHRDQLFTFLGHPGLDATNWRGEQAIRPAVVNRKVWGGSRTHAGAAAQSILMSVLRTCLQQHRDALQCMSRAIRGQRPRLALLPAGP